MMHYSKASIRGEFETSLFGCCNDCGTLCYALFCTPCAIAHAWSDARDEKCQICHVVGGELYIKANIRHVRGMEMNYCSDCLALYFCTLCTIVQDLNEIKIIKAEYRIQDSDIEINTA